MRRRWRYLIGGVLAVVVVAAVVVTVGRSTPPADAARTPRLVVVGDSLSTGFGTSSDDAWPHLLAQRTRGRLDVVNASENGAGYLAGGDDNATFGSNEVDAVTPDTQTVLFFGSDNDEGSQASDLTAAAVAALHSAHATAPDARLIVVGPPAYTTPTPARLAVRDALKAAASATNARFVDPLAEKWMNDQRFAGPDDEHPSVAGQQQLLKEMTRVLGI
ncbi:SGNH/GDSL hydrolase family protein [Tersicoccus sp. MR15.9]|uniref:SGNH/GDSL hydrolase family protein n=1 Tax=Tersicoccus mangrovi TaxID=3121635 RepID=UPI002FE5547C